MITSDKKDITLLPMYIEAIMVGKKAEETYADIDYNYASLIDAPNGKDLAADPFRLHEGESKGIHLHWILPEQFTHGEQKEEQGDIRYPLIPNRWFVTRVAILYKKEHELPVSMKKTWLIEGDCLVEDPDNPDIFSMIHYGDAEQPYRYVGSVSEYTGTVTSNEEHLEALKAITTGLPYFTAYYPQCRNVLGFYDSLKDIQLNNSEDYADITYIVSGWVETPLQESTKIVHGAINSLLWKGKNVVYDSGVPFHKNRMNIAVGRTSKEAMAALSSQYAEKEELEDMMHSLLLGELQEWGELDGQRDVLQKIHRDAFEAISSKPELNVKNKQGQSRLTENQYSLLNEIEQLYQKEMEEEEGIEIVKQNIYTLWRASQAKTALDYSSEQKTVDKIDQLEEDLTASYDRHAKLEQSIEQKKEELRKTCTDEEELMEREGQQYWKPTEMVLLLEGAKQESIYKKIQKYQEMEYGDTTVSHRTGLEIVTSVSAEIFNIFKDSTITFGKQELQAWFPDNKTELPAIIDSLVQEGILTSRSCVRYMMMQFLKQQQLEITASRITDVVNLYFLRMTTEAAKRLPNPMVNIQWVPPWNPLFIEWEMIFYPDSQLLEEDFQLKNWELQGLDLQYKGRPFLYQNAYEYRGRSILTPQITDIMAEQFREFNDERFPDISRKLKETKALSQCLGGFNDALMLKDRNQVVLPWQKKNPVLDAHITQLIGDTAVFTECKEKQPLFNIRSGKCKLNHMHLIDTMGRCCEYDIGKIIVPQHMRYQDSAEDAEFLLPPRFLCPVRLYTQWDQVSSVKHDDVTYIYGWIWANITESSFHVYDADGIFKGSLQIIFDTNDHSRYHIAFQNPPGEFKEIEELLADSNTRLRQFILDFIEVCTKDATVLYDLLQAVSESMWNIHTNTMQKNSDIFAYLGHPLALVGLHMALERKQESQVQSNIRTSKIDKTIVETKIGEYEKQKDGVIGFFLHKDDKKTYKKLHVCIDKPIDNGYMDNVTTIPMSFDTQKNPISMTLIVSAYGKITITTGLLPVKELKISEELVEAALQNIYMTLFYGPFLTPQQELQLYLPKGMEKEWSYIEYERPKEKKEYTDIQQPWLEAVQNIDNIKIREGWLKLNAKQHTNTKKQ